MRQKVKLGEIGTFIRGVSYKKGDLLPKRENGCISLLRSNNIQAELDLSELQYLNKNSVKNEQITQKGDILFCMSNGSPHLVGKNVLLPELENYSFGAFCSIFRKTNESVLSEYIAKYLQSGNYTSFITSLSRGAGINNLRGSDLENIEIPLPPLETQKAIVAKLDQIFAELDQTKSEIQNNLDSTNELWKSALNQAFQGDWEMKKLGEVCEIERGGSPRPIQEFLTTAENGVNWIKIGDTKTQPKYIEFTQEKIKPEGVKRSRMVYPGDFILSNSMSFGRPYIMKTSGCIHDGRLVLRPDNTVDKEFLYYLLGSDFMYKKFESTASGTGVKNLNIDKVKVIEISIPPLSEQEKIVEHLDQVSKEVKALKSQYQSQLDNLEELKKSVLDKAFKGELE